MSEWVVTNRGIVLTKHCDHYGHMNVRFYAHFFDDGAWHVWTQAGIKMLEFNQRGLGVVVANTSTNFIKETKPGTLVMVTGGFTKTGNKSVTYEQRLLDAESEQLHATQTTTEVFFDTDKRASTAMPDDIRAKIEANLVG